MNPWIKTILGVVIIFGFSITLNQLMEPGILSTMLKSLVILIVILVNNFTNNKNTEHKINQDSH
ncbi:ribose/xylose/arabinose/galactoside ABC-type transport system permease subunit [Lysinibacillus sp. RC79]